MPPREIRGIEELRTLAGQQVATSEWLNVSQTLIDTFARATGDEQWIHCDSERARTESPYGGTVAHGFLTLSLLSRLHGQAVRITGDFKMAVNYGLNRVRFPTPVPSGARVRSLSTLVSVEESPGGYQVVWQVSVEVENNPKPALVAEWLVRYYSGGG